MHGALTQPATPWLRTLPMKTLIGRASFFLA